MHDDTFEEAKQLSIISIFSIVSYSNLYYKGI